MQAQAPQSNGIAALVQGNAAPMQPQAQVPAGPNQGIPPDLKQLLAQQARNELQQAAQRYQALQQALQMGQGAGKPPTVAQQVEMQGQQMQQAPQAEQGLPGMTEPPQEMARGGLIRLPSNLPSNYAGGGIVAFKTGDSVEDAELTEAEKLQAITDAQNKEAWERVKRFFSEPGMFSEEVVRKKIEEDRQNAYRTEGRNVPAPVAPEGSWGAPVPMPKAAPNEEVPPNATWAGTRLDPNYEYATLNKWRQQAPHLYAAYVAKYPEAVEEATPARRAQPTPRAQLTPEGIAALPGAPAPATAPPETPHELAAPLNKSLKTVLEADPRAQTRGDITQLQQYRGLPELLKQQQAIIDEQKARQAAASQNRVPAWAIGAMNAQAGPRQNLGAFLASMGKGAMAADANYAAADETNASKIDMLRTKLIEAQMAGNEKDAAEYSKLLERNIMGQGNAQQSAASVLNTAENVSQRREAAQGRLAEMSMRNNELQQRIRDSGDVKLLTQVSMIQKAAAAEATKRAITEVKERDPFASESSPLVASKAAQYEAEALASNVVYQKALKEYMGDGYVAPKAAPDTNNLAAAAAAELARRGIK